MQCAFQNMNNPTDDQQVIHARFPVRTRKVFLGTIKLIFTQIKQITHVDTFTISESHIIYPVNSEPLGPEPK